MQKICTASLFCCIFCFSVTVAMELYKLFNSMNNILLSLAILYYMILLLALGPDLTCTYSFYSINTGPSCAHHHTVPVLLHFCSLAYHDVFLCTSFTSFSLCSLNIRLSINQECKELECWFKSKLVSFCELVHFVVTHCVYL